MDECTCMHEHWLDVARISVGFAIYLVPDNLKIWLVKHRLGASRVIHDGGLHGYWYNLCQVFRSDGIFHVWSHRIPVFLLCADGMIRTRINTWYDIPGKYGTQNTYSARCQIIINGVIESSPASIKAWLSLTLFPLLHAWKLRSSSIFPLVITTAIDLRFFACHPTMASSAQQHALQRHMPSQTPT